MKKIHHWCQDVRGALRNWSKSQWDDVGEDNGMTGAAAKKHFELYQLEGKRVIPMSVPPCDGFSYETGCPGHPVPEENSMTLGEP